MASEGKVVEIEQIINRDVFQHTFSYSSIYDDPETAPGIFKNIQIGLHAAISTVA